MKTLWLLLYYSFIPAVFLLDFFCEPIHLKKIGGLQIVSNIILGFYYISYRKSRFILIDWYLIEALLFTSVSGILLLIFDNQQLLMFINTVGFYLTHFMYINVFRSEGSILPALSSVFREWKIIVFTILFFVGLAFFLIIFTPNSLLLITFVYSTQMMVLCWMAYFRPIPTSAFNMSLAGAFLLVISNILLAINLLYQIFPYSVGIYFVVYATSQWLIVESILYNRNQIED